MRVQLERRYRFSAAHRYDRPEWSPEENVRRFGKCNLSPGHGHNYQLRVRVEGEPDSLSGFVVDLGELDRIVKAQVLDPLDHRHLNAAVPEFAPGGAIPSSENLLLWILKRISPALPGGCELVELWLAEDEDLAAVWTASRARP
jgi:6-pyruvoyltetrahydropterin/6-carboxytetrahydropterin synthase